MMDKGATTDDDEDDNNIRSCASSILKHFSKDFVRSPKSVTSKTKVS
jgi:hypothetical protein